MDEASSSDGDPNHSLYSLLRACQRGQRFAVVGSHDDIDESITPFLNDLYVDDTTQDQRVSNFFADQYESDGKLIVVTGSAGDGKSALLSKGYLAARETGHSEVTESQINMDATASDSKHQRYKDRLQEFLERVLPQAENGEGPRAGLAINYGLAVDFFQQHNASSDNESFQNLWQALQDSRKDPDGIEQTDSIEVINLSHRELYATHPDTLGEGLLLKMVEKFGVDNAAESPIATAYERERDQCPAGDSCPLHYNVQALAEPAIRRRIAELIAGWNIITGTYFNPRGILDLLASILLPGIPQEKMETDKPCPVGAAVTNGAVAPQPDHLIWNRLFAVLSRAESKMATRIDPLAQSSIELDTWVLTHRNNRGELAEMLDNPPGTSEATSLEVIKTALRYQYLKEEDLPGLLEQPAFTQYQSALTILNNDDPQQGQAVGEGIKEFYSTVKEALRGWSGPNMKSDEIEFVDANRSPSYRFLSQWGDPKEDHENTQEETREQTVPGRIHIKYENPTSNDGQRILIPLTFELYQLMRQITQGYTPNAADIEHSEAVMQIKAKLADLTRKQEFMRVINRSNERQFTIDNSPYAAPTVHREGEWQ